MQGVYSLVILFLYFIILANLDFITTLSFKAFIDLDFKAGFKATLKVIIKLIFNIIIEALVL